MPIRIFHRSCGGLCGWWKTEPSYFEDFNSVNYVSPSMLPLVKGDDVHCGKCNCRVNRPDTDFILPTKPGISYEELLSPKRV